MREINLTESELFKSLIEIDAGDTYLDLHNDYDCFEFTYSNKELLLLFKPLKVDGTSGVVRIKFEDALLWNISMTFRSIVGNTTLDNFYRGRFEDNGLLKEYSEDGRPYFYLEFYEGCSVELLSKQTKVFIEEAPNVT